MASTITSSGLASGIDFESIISASVEAKKAQYAARTSSTKQETNYQISGLGNLKSTLSSFKDTCDNIAKENSFNKRNISIKQSSDDPIFTATAKSDVSNGNYNITVTQLCQSTSYSTTVADASEELGEGTLKFSIGEGDDAKEFEVSVSATDTLTDLRKKINEAGGSFSVNANIITLADGSSKFILESGLTGDKYSNFSVSSTGSDKLSQFTAGNTKDSEGNVTKTGNMNIVRVAQDAKIDVDGETITSSTNKFENKIAGLDIEVNRLSDTQTITETDAEGNEKTTTGFKSNNLSITTDTSSLSKMVSNFLDAYNTVRDKMDSLSARNSYTDGVSNDDGGLLAGDATCSTIKSSLANIISNFNTGFTELDTLFQMGVEMDNDGKLSLDTTKFNEALENHYDQIVAAFSGDNGICKKLSENLNEYTKSGGLIATREDSLNSTLRSITNRENSYAEMLEKYEESLRAKYASLDSYIGSMNTSLSYITSAMSSLNSNKSSS